VHGDMNLSALGNTHQRSRILQLAASLAKRVHCHASAIFAFRMPNTFADFEAEGEYSVPEFTGRMVILIGHNRG